MTDPDPRGNALDPAERDRLWNWLLHEGTLFVGRQQLFAVSEAMLLAAYATLMSANPRNREVIIVMILGGLFSSLLWIATNYNQRNHTILPIRDALKGAFPSYDQIEHQRSKKMRSTVATGYVYPVLTVVIWAALLRYS